MHPDHPHPLLEDGQGDPPLSPLECAQAEAVGRRLRDAGLDAVYVTTLRRTRETAQPLVDATGPPPRVEPDLRELHLGEWEAGLVLQRVAQGDPVAARVVAEQRWDLIPGAEPAAALATRVQAPATLGARMRTQDHSSGRIRCSPASSRVARPERPA